MTTVARATVLTHRRPADTADALAALIVAARGAGVELVIDTVEANKHGLSHAEGLKIVPEAREGVDLCIVLGGDGTILTGLRRFAGTGVPVFAVNFGEVGFLAAVEAAELPEAFGPAFENEFEVVRLPAIEVGPAGSGRVAFNDVSVHRQPGMRVAQLSYAVSGAEVGHVRCDGLVVATPAGSTGYNLANGGPVLAWGVEGFVVSFIAPHSLTARALVVAPDGELSIRNSSSEEAVELSLDGRPDTTLAPGEEVAVRFVEGHGALAQVNGWSFYRRLREKFGRLAS